MNANPALMLDAAPQSDQALPEVCQGLAARFDRFVFLGRRDDGNASLRIHFGALEAALRLYGLAVENVAPDAPVLLDDRCALVFYYNDPEAIHAIRAGGLAARSGLSLCLGSDIRKLSQYLTLADIVDGFIMPSQPHRAALELQCPVPVRVVREGIDPLAGTPAGPRARDRSLVWFGYPESYYRGMKPFEPVIAQALAARQIDRFALITKAQALDPRAAPAQVIPFSAQSFGADLGSFGYALLSHAPCDLHLNSLIKSPNKVITALAAGLVPLATATPNYAQIMEELGLGRFLFRSPYELGNLLARLDPQADGELLAELRPRARLEELLGPEAILRDFAEAVADLLPQRDAIRAFVRRFPAQRPQDEYFGGFTDSLREAAHSFRRVLAMRLR